MGETDSIIGQGHAWDALDRMFRSRRIPNALLFTGIPGIGKQTTARIFARACNCQETLAVTAPDPSGTVNSPSSRRLQFCSRCRSCRRMEAGNHPDILQVKPEKSEITIGQIREICRVLAMKPYEAQLRVVIVAEADRMNPPAGNALLKVLEEPPENTLLILTARQSQDLLSTIASRCQELRFRPLYQTEVEEILTNRYGVDPDSASVIASFSDGSVGRALEMNHPTWFLWKKWITDILSAWSTLPTNVRLGFGEKLLSNPSRLDQSLDMIAGWYRDLLMAKHGYRIFLHTDRTREIVESAARKSSIDLVSCLVAIKQTRDHKNARGNQRILLDHLMLELI